MLYFSYEHFRDLCFHGVAVVESTKIETLSKRTFKQYHIYQRKPI